MPLMQMLEMFTTTLPLEPPFSTTVNAPTTKGPSKVETDVKSGPTTTVLEALTVPAGMVYMFVESILAMAQRQAHT